MRISDWSSDVCSSDLPQLPAVDHVLGVGEELRPGGEDPRPVGPLLVAEAVDQRRDVDGAAGVAVGPPRAAGRSEERRVGNACGSTCRSRRWPKHSTKNNCTILYKTILHNNTKR